MTTITPDEMKSLEMLFMSETGTPSILLMEHAAQGVAAAISRHAPKSARVLFLCGPGNNGGDGYAAARLWRSGGGQADVWEVTSAVRGDALTNRTLALLHGVRILPSADAVDVAEYAAVVDALYGTGLNHAIEGDAAILIHRLSDHPQIPVIAVDIPSGLDGTTGRALGADVVRAAETVTFHRIKQGLLLRQGVEYTGKITVQPILIRPGDDIDLGFDGLETLSPAALAPLFARTPALHKGDCGRAVIFCGSRGMVGAAAFCANACIRAGAGLTTLLCRESLLPMLQVLAPGATCVPLPETNGLLTPQAARITRETLDKADAACIGCGCGLTPSPATFPSSSMRMRFACWLKTKRCRIRYSPARRTPSSRRTPAKRRACWNSTSSSFLMSRWMPYRGCMTCAAAACCSRAHGRLCPTATQRTSASTARPHWRKGAAATCCPAS